MHNLWDDIVQGLVPVDLTALNYHYVLFVPICLSLEVALRLKGFKALFAGNLTKIVYRTRNLTF